MTEHEARELFRDHCKVDGNAVLERYGENAAVAAILAATSPDTVPPPEIARMQADLTYQAKLLIRLRDTLININDDIDDEGDRVFFGSTNDADSFRQVVADLDDFQWSRIIPQIQHPDIYAEMRGLRGGFHEIIENAPSKPVGDRPTVGFQSSSDPEQDDGNEVVEEAFQEGIKRGLWLAAEIANQALAKATGTQS